MRLLAAACVALGLSGCVADQAVTPSVLRAFSPEANQVTGLTPDQVDGCLQNEESWRTVVGVPVSLDDFEIVGSSYSAGASLKSARHRIVGRSWTNTIDPRVRAYIINLKSKEGRVFGGEQKFWCFGEQIGDKFTPLVSTETKSGKVTSTIYANVMVRLYDRMGPPAS